MNIKQLRIENKDLEIRYFKELEINKRNSE